MLRRFGLAVVLCCLPAAARAQEAPEDLIPATAQIYVRWDGIDAHQGAYAKTALGQMMLGDTGKFVQTVFAQVQEQVGGSLTVQQLLGGAAPDKLQKLQADATEATKLLPVLGKRGFVLAAEVRSAQPPDGYIILVLPDAGKDPKPAFATLRLAAAVAKAEVKEKQIAGRKVNILDAGQAPVQLSWWVEGKHAVLLASTQPPEEAVKALTAKGDRLTSNPLYKRVHGFSQFETGARAFIDVASGVRLARKQGKEVGKVIDDLGLDGVKSLVFYSGFDGRAERSLVEIDAPGPRKGLLQLMGSERFKLEDAPPLPDDVTSWSMTNFDPAQLYDTTVLTVENVVKLVSPDDLPKFKDVLQQINQTLGIDLRKDFLANLGGRVVTYTSPAEGPLNLGQTFLVKVKDAEKLQESIDQAIKGIGQAAGADVSVKKRKYRGVELREVHVRKEGFIFVPTYAIHDGWLVFGYFPQQVQGFILRAKGELPTWKPSETTRAAFAKMPKECVSISVSDPRPSVKQILSITPLILGAINSFAKDVNLDVGSVPNSHEVARHLFPNVSVVTDDGKTIRQEARASLALPFDLNGIDTYGLFIAFSVLGRVGK